MRNKVLWIGIAALVIGAACNPAVLGRLFLADGKVDSLAGQIFVLSCDLVVILFGVWLILGHKVLTVKDALFRGIILLLVVIAVEGGLHLFTYVHDVVRGIDVDRRAPLSLYAEKPWAEELFKEYHEARIEFDQYLCWRGSEYQGRQINVDRDGFRRSVNVQTSGQAKPDTLMVFGGSSIWGSYVRDAYTVPSCMGRRLAEAGDSSVVVNCGERGYTFTQGVLRLVLLLKRGFHPTRVIFIDGYNDVLSAYRVGKEGIVGLYPEVRTLVEIRGRSLNIRMGEAVAQAVASTSLIYRGFEHLAALLRPAPRPSPDNLARLGRGIADEYVSSYRLLEKLSGQYGFEFTCFLQPTLFTKRFLSAEEKQSDPLLDDEDFRKLYIDTDRRLMEMQLSRLYDLAYLFDKDISTIYSDACHLSEDGNAVLADALFRIALAGGRTL